MSSYSAVVTADVTAFAATARFKRLNKSQRNWVLGLALDLVFGAGPWVVGSAVAAAVLAAIYKNVDGSVETFQLFNAPVALGAISTFASFLLVSKQAANFGKNATIVGEFGNLSGSLINICLFLKSQISSGKSIEFLTLSDGAGGFYQTTRLGLACASVMYIVKYEGRGSTIRPTGLPLGQDSRLINSYARYTSPANGSPGMAPFAACMLIVSELIDEFQAGEKPSEYAVLFGQINAVTAAEGAIGGTAGYSGPLLAKWLLFLLYVLYLLLLLITDLVPNNEWNSVWIVSILAFCTVAYFQISERYQNPMKLRTSTSGQKPFVSETCRGTEIAITSIFGRSKSMLLGGDTGSSIPHQIGHHAISFSLGK